MAQKYVEAIGNLASAPNQRVILFPIEASNFIGSLGGIAEIAKSAFGGDDVGANGGTGGDNGAQRRGSVPLTPQDNAD